jgi:lysophospholipase L1-like esterase
LLARGRQVGFGQPHGDLVPLCGLHWGPGAHRDLELLNVATGAVAKTPVTAQAVAKAYPEWLRRQFGDGPVSVYIPMLSPDLSRVFFKMASPAGGDFRSRQASRREGLLCYDLRAGRFLPMRERWGHPAWHPDSRHIINVPAVVIDSDTGKSRAIPNAPKLPGSHPSFGPDGLLFASDTLATPFGGPAKSWAVGVGDAGTGEFVRVHTFDNSKGAQSWRVSHPHPVFSPDGRRLYFNVSADDWTRLYVAEIAGEAGAKKGPLRIVLLGDSTVCDYPPAASVRGWGQYLAEGFKGPVVVRNLAASGRSTKTFLKEGRLQKALAERADFALIQFGHNDSHAKGRPESTDAATDFRENLRTYVQEFRKTGTVPILVTPMHRRTFRAGKVTEELKPYADAMKAVAAEMKVPVVDLYTRSGELLERLGDAGSADLSNSAKDRTHFSEKGARAMARLVLDGLKTTDARLGQTIN